MAPERLVAELPMAERLGWFGGGKMLVVWERRQSALCWVIELYERIQLDARAQLQQRA